MNVYCAYSIRGWRVITETKVKSPLSRLHGHLEYGHAVERFLLRHCGAGDVEAGAEIQTNPRADT